MSRSGKIVPDDKVRRNDNRQLHDAAGEESSIVRCDGDVELVWNYREQHLFRDNRGNGDDSWIRRRGQVPGSHFKSRCSDKATDTSAWTSSTKTLPTPLPFCLVLSKCSK